MRSILSLLAGTAAILMLCSCGSLTQHIEGKGLSPATVDFAQKMREEPSWDDMDMTYDGVSHSTDKWCSNVSPFIIFWNWTTLGSFEKDKHFGVRKVAMFFPAFYTVRNSLYNANGERRETGLEWNLAFVLGFENFQNYDGESWKTGVIWFPGIGPFLGIGPSYFQICWLELTAVN